MINSRVAAVASCYELGYRKQSQRKTSQSMCWLSSSKQVTKWKRSGVTWCLLASRYDMNSTLRTDVLRVETGSLTLNLVFSFPPMANGSMSESCICQKLCSSFSEYSFVFCANCMSSLSKTGQKANARSMRHSKGFASKLHALMKEPAHVRRSTRSWKGLIPDS